MEWPTSWPLGKNHRLNLPLFDLRSLNLLADPQIKLIMSHIIDDSAEVNEKPDPTIASSRDCPLLLLPTELLIDIIADINAAYLGDSDHKSDPLIALRL